MPKVHAVIPTGSATNFLTTATWADCDVTSFPQSEAAQTSIATSYAKGTAAQPGAITISAMGVKICARSGSTGTFSTSLFGGTTSGTADAAVTSDNTSLTDTRLSFIGNDWVGGVITCNGKTMTITSVTGGNKFVGASWSGGGNPGNGNSWSIVGGIYPGTEVTINMSDLPACDITSANGGWVSMKFGANVTLQAATNYQVQVKASVSNSLNLWRDATANNWSCYLRTTTSTAVGAGDTFINIGRDYTGAGTGTNAIVIMDETTTTIYGASTAVANALITPGIAINQGGTLKYDPAINGYLKIADSIIVYTGGTFSIGESGARIGSTKTAILEFASAANVDYGLVIRALSTCNLYGDNARATSTLMTADKVGTNTVITLGSTAGWETNDVLVFASTSRTNSETESKIISTVDSPTQVTLTAGLTNAHSGTSPTQAEVINLTRNVKIRGLSSSLNSYVVMFTTATVNADYVEFYWLGSGTTNKRGIDCGVTTGVATITHCSMHDFTVASSEAFKLGSSSGTGVTFSNNVVYNIAFYHMEIASNSGGSIIDSNIFLVTSSAAYIISANDVGGTFTNNVMSGGASAGIAVNESGIFGNWSNNTIHSCNGGVGLQGGLRGTINGFTVWRCSGINLQQSDVTINNYVAFGNVTRNILANTGTYIFNNLILNGDTTFATTNGLEMNNASTHSKIIINSGNFGTASGIKTAHTNDINIPGAGGYCEVILNNTILASGTPLLGNTYLSPNSIVRAERINQTAGNHKAWLKYGILDIASPSIVGMTNPVLRMLPNNATSKLESAPIGMGMKVAVANGSTLTSISVDIYKVAAYNGNQPRLIMRRNDAMGVTADTVIDTATVGTGTLETLTGTATKTGGGNFTDDGTLEFIVDCDGTDASGYVYVDNWVVVGAQTPDGQSKYWYEGLPLPIILPASTGGTGTGFFML